MSLRRLLRSGIRSLRSNHVAKLQPAEIDQAMLKSRHLVRIYYILSVYLSAVLMRSTEGYVRTVTEWDFLWPLYWVSPERAGIILSIMTVGCFCLSLLAAVRTDNRLIRILFSLSFLLVSAIENSRGGGINHTYHAWFWISFILIFLPGENRTRGGHTAWSFRMSWLTAVFMAQVALALFYSMAGFWKVWYGILAALAGIDGNFSPKGFSYQLADRMLTTNTSPLLAEFFIEYYVLGWLGFLAIIYIQFTAIVTVFRPRLHVVWGAALIAFHLGTWLLMEIIFIENVLLLLIFFIMSPFAERKPDFEKTIGDLPLFGSLVLRLLQGQLSILPVRLRGGAGQQNS